MNEAWIKLTERLPEGKEWVLLFHGGIHTEGLSRTVSVNPEYVRNGNALKSGFTHWAYIPYPLPLPGGYTEPTKE
jgi:hypothetical protein